MGLMNGKDADDNGTGKEKGPRPEGTLRGISMLASMGITMVACTFIGLLIGIYLDKRFGTEPWLTMIFLILGIAAGFRNIYTTAKRNGL